MAVATGAVLVAVASLGGTIMVGTLDAMTAVEGMAKVVSGCTVITSVIEMNWVASGSSVDEVVLAVVDAGAARIRVVALGIYCS